jgi:6-phosphogluconolactonase (cycloisomerase 2 family)
MAVGLGMTACSRDYTLGYLYVTNAKATPGQITAYSIDYQSGALTQLTGSPFSSGGNNPVTLAASPNNQFVYVVNQGTSTVVAYTIGSGGQLTAGKASAVLASNATSTPTSIAVDPAGKFLYVAFKYQTGTTGPGGITCFPINADGSLGTALPFVALGNNPSGIAIPATGGFVYVVDQESPLTSTAHGVLLSFTENVATGALTAVSGSYFGGVAAGTTPSAVAADPSGHFLYVTDQATNQLYGYTFTGGGAPLAMLNSPFTAGLFPIAVTVDPRGMFVYVVNFASSTVGTYTINRATGALSGASGGATVATGPTCVTIDPAIGLYLYTSNNTDNSVSAEQLDPHSGALKGVQGTQFSSQGLPTCAVAVANGAHATQIVE